MIGEINNTHYCAGIFYPDKETCSKDGVREDEKGRKYYPPCKEKCILRHRKWPTPEQFKEEYGKDYPDDGVVWERFIKPLKDGSVDEWMIVRKSHRYGNEGITECVCACTPWGQPPENWRPCDQLNELKHCGSCKNQRNDCELFQRLNKPKTEMDIKADKYYEFMRKEGLTRKLSFHDMRKIFSYFKDFWEMKCDKADKTPDGKCVGYQKSETDDEPADMCLNCKDNIFYEDGDKYYKICLSCKHHKTGCQTFPCQPSLCPNYKICGNGNKPGCNPTCYEAKNQKEVENE